MGLTFDIFGRLATLVDGKCWVRISIISVFSNITQLFCTSYVSDLCFCMLKVILTKVRPTSPIGYYHLLVQDHGKLSIASLISETWHQFYLLIYITWSLFVGIDLSLVLDVAG